MKFKNPTNGHIEIRTGAGLWTLLFGGLYFMSGGIWSPLVVWFAILFAAFYFLGPAAFVFAIIVNIFMAFAASSMVRSSFLNKGWIEIDEDSPNSPEEVSAFRKCPFCAEEIRGEAVKCKHCGSEVPALPQAEKIDPLAPEHLSSAPPKGVVINDHIEAVLNRYGAKQTAFGYVWKGKEITSFSDLVLTIKNA